MAAPRRRPFSYWRNGLEVGLPVLLWNAFAIVSGHRRRGLYGDLLFVGVLALLFMATRLWPEKIHFRRPGE